jgi:hypothetical protein
MPWFFVQRALVRVADATRLRFLPFVFPRRLGTLQATFTGRHWILLVCFGLASSNLLAQSNAPNISSKSSRQSLGPFDKDIVIPDAKGPLGQRDSGASSELSKHLTVVGASSWTGVVGTGQITYGTTDSTAYSATLSILGGTGFRLDSQTSRGPLSIRISGRHGTIQEADGRQFPILPDTAATGIVQFVQPRLPNFPGATGSLLDRGPIVVDGVSMHRVTIESPGAGHDLVTGKATIINHGPIFRFLHASLGEKR